MTDQDACDRVTIDVTNRDPTKPELDLAGVAELVRGFLLRRVAPAQVQLLELSHLKVTGTNSQPTAEFYAELSEPIEFEPGNWSGSYGDLKIEKPK
jgi:hypothetical protein